MNVRFFFLSLLLVFASTCALAEGTRTWQQTKYSEFEEGTVKGVAIRSDGVLQLAPAFHALVTTPSTYIWAIATDGDGAVYVAAGLPARVYRITPEGKSIIVFKTEELQVQSLAVSPRGEVFAATSPDGRIYRITRQGSVLGQRMPSTGSTDSSPGVAVDPNWTSSVYFEPRTKYIWQLLLDPQGRLYVATGDHGEIFRVTPDGKGTLFFKSDEAHIRALALDAKGNLIAGSDGSGLVYRISPQGEAFVLYSAPRKEITALALDGKGNIYAAGVGEKRGTGANATSERGIRPSSPGITPDSSGKQPQAADSGTEDVVITLESDSGAAQSSAPALASAPLPQSGSEIYRIAPDGSPARIWNSQEETVYALAFDPQGHLLAGTGNKGRVFAVGNDDSFTDLLKASASQVTGFAAAPNGGLYVCTSNLGKLFTISASLQQEGTYESDVFDARTFSRWGRAEVRGEGTFELWARSGNVDNPDRNWSPWKPVSLREGARLDVPPARFVQWRLVLRPGSPPARIESVLVHYLPRNVAPRIDNVVVQTGTRYSPVRAIGTDLITLSSSAPAPSPGNVRSETPFSAVPDHESIGVRWSARDENDDQLVYSIFYRGDGESSWKLLKDGLTDKFYSFEAGLLPDGGYTIKVLASDRPSNSPDEVLTAERTSEHLDIDTTPPRIESLTATVQGEGLRVTFRASDTFSSIKRAAYSVDAGEWRYLEPVGRLSDSRQERYDFTTKLPAQRNTEGEHLVVVRVWDRFDNAGSAKAVVQEKK